MIYLIIVIYIKIYCTTRMHRKIALLRKNFIGRRAALFLFPISAFFQIRAYREIISVSRKLFISALRLHTIAKRNSQLLGIIFVRRESKKNYVHSMVTTFIMFCSKLATRLQPYRNCTEIIKKNQP